MKIFEYLGVAAVAVIVTYFATTTLSKPLQVEPAKWTGKITAVNKEVAVEVPATFQKLHWDDQGIGKGAMLYQADFTLMFGVDFPNNWELETNKGDDGTVDITLPKLALLNEIKVQFKDQTEANICNKASGARLLRMNADVTAEAFQAFQAKADELLKTNKNIYNISRQSLEGYYMKVLNKANKENPVMAVNIKFSGEPIF